MLVSCSWWHDGYRHKIRCGSGFTFFKRWKNFNPTHQWKDHPLGVHALDFLGQFLEHIRAVVF